jgi:signal transduction histidine kinase/ligand-binding sensor domain-containing protein
MRGLKKISILMIWVVSELTYSQYENIQFSSLTVNDGLSEDKVSSVVQDIQGFMWFGTPSGLNRYDGYNFKVYSHDPNNAGSISSNNISRLYKDKEGTLWIGTQDGGLNRYNREFDNFTVYKHDPTDLNSISGNTILSIFEDSKGYLWVGNAFDGLNKFDRKRNIFIHYNHNPNDPSSISNNSIRCVCEDSLGNLWLGTSAKGLDELDIKTRKFIHFSYNAADTNSISDNILRFLSIDKHQNLWIGTYNGLNELSLNDLKNESPAAVKFKRYYLDITGLWGSRFESMCIDDNGIFWLGTFKGLVFFDPEKESFIPCPVSEYNGLLGKSVNSIFEDKSGRIWLAVGSGVVTPAVGGIITNPSENKGGINIFDKKRKRFNIYWYKPGLPNSLNIGLLSYLNEDKEGNLWLGDGGSYLWKWDKGKNVLTKIIPNSIGNKYLNRLLIDSKNRFWVTVGPDLEIDRFDISTRNLIRYCDIEASEKNLTFEDKEGNFYMRTHNGLFQFDSSMSLLKIYKHDENDTNSLDNNWVNDIFFEDNDSNIWLTTASGLNKLERKTGRFIHYHSIAGDSGSINCTSVQAMYEDSSSNLWFATYGGGLNKLDRKTNRFSHITKNDGFADNFMSALFTDNYGNFWISSNSGISKYNPRDGNIKNYSVEDGLQGKEFGLIEFKSKTGELFFGGYFGLNTFYPDSIKDNLNIPPIVLTAFKLFEKNASLDTSITYKKEITLPYDSNFFSFEFAALDYTNPSKNLYAYKLEGVDKDWIHTNSSDRTANYTDIKPGEYIFRVKGSNNDGIWNEEGISIRILITPPWWKRLWFRIFSLSMLLAVFGGTIRFVSVQRLRRKLALEKERLRISNDMHDEVGSSLTRITLLSELAKRKLGDTEEIKRISDASRAVVNSMDEIVWAVNPKYDTLDNLAAYILQFAQEFFDASGISCRFEFPNDIPCRYLSSEIRHNVFLVVKEALNNIVKHSVAAEVNIGLTINQDNFEFKISDDGKGFNIDERDQFSNGINNIQKRITEIKGTISVDSKSGKGTRIMINVPV